MSPRAERGRSADTSGFTLIEALVAFTVMATVLGVLNRGVVQPRAGAVTFGARTPSPSSAPGAPFPTAAMPATATDGAGP